MTADWVKESFKWSQNADERRYFLPPLKGYVIAVTDIDAAERERVREQVTPVLHTLVISFTTKWAPLAPIIPMASLLLASEALEIPVNVTEGAEMTPHVDAGDDSRGYLHKGAPAD